MRPFGGATDQGRAFAVPSCDEAAEPLQNTHRCDRRPEAVRTVCHFRSFAEDVALHSTASGWWGAKGAPFRQSCCEKTCCCNTFYIKKNAHLAALPEKSLLLNTNAAGSGVLFFDARFFLMRVFFDARFFFPRGVYKVLTAKSVVYVRRQGPLFGSPLAAAPPPLPGWQRRCRICTF